MAICVFVHPITNSTLWWGSKSDTMSRSPKYTHIINVAHDNGVSLRHKHKIDSTVYTEVPMVDDQFLEYRPDVKKRMAFLSNVATSGIREGMDVSLAKTGPGLF
jgi:hypothetical protein